MVREKKHDQFEIEVGFIGYIYFYLQFINLLW
jgi:hypothetical protein